MNMEQNTPINNTTTDTEKNKTPDDKAGFYVRNFLKIYDPETGQIAVETSN